nr:MAG TPA: hypothetical protein [Caudoviricetes sp.]
MRLWMNQLIRTNSYSHIFHCSSCKVSSYFSSSNYGTSRAATQGLVSGFRATYIAS